MTTHKTAPEQPVQKATAAELAERVRLVMKHGYAIHHAHVVVKPEFLEEIAAELTRLAEAEIKLASDDGLYAEFKSQERRIAELEQRLSWRRVREEPMPFAKLLLMRHVDESGNEWFNVEEHGALTDRSITHWMPLPPIPDGEKEPT